MKRTTEMDIGDIFKDFKSMEVVAAICCSQIIEDEPQECPHCEGSGAVDCRPGNSGDHEVANEDGQVECPTCEGRGYIK